MRAFIIPEDFRKDQYILKPVFTRLFQHLGASSIRVTICREPLLGGIGEALKTERLAEIVQRRRGMFDLFILCVDRDGEVGRRQRLNDIEAEFGPNFLAENAWEEIETWVLAGLNLPSQWRWQDVRAAVHVKEQYFEPFADLRNVSGTLAGGRKVLGEEASRRINSIRQKCPEDFDGLAQRLEMGIREA